MSSCYSMQLFYEIYNLNYDEKKLFVFLYILNLEGKSKMFWFDTSRFKKFKSQTKSQFFHAIKFQFSKFTKWFLHEMLSVLQRD